MFVETNQLNEQQSLPPNEVPIKIRKKKEEKKRSKKRRKKKKIS
jgi:hypothetical protein